MYEELIQSAGLSVGERFSKPFPEEVPQPPERCLSTRWEDPRTTVRRLTEEPYRVP